MKRKAQVWIETMIYTLIALALIAMVLSFARPKIEEARDKVVVEQTLSALQGLNDEINSIWKKGAGNQRTPELTVKDGTLTFDGLNETIIFLIVESNYQFSEIGKEINISDNVQGLTEKKQDRYKIMFKINYKNKINLSVENNINGIKEITKASTPYKLIIKNNGIDDNGNAIVDIRVIY